MSSRIDVSAFAARAHAGPPQRLGQRYDLQKFLPDPGNTVVCHLDLDTPAGQAVLQARARMMKLPGYSPIQRNHLITSEQCSPMELQCCHMQLTKTDFFTSL